LVCIPACVAAVAVALVAPAAASAIDFCSPAERGCARVVVPLDRSGKVPGRIGLQVEISRAKRPQRPPLFLIAGGPGQSATRAFTQGSIKDLLGSELRARNVVVMDLRGTGDSGVLRCRPLERSNILDARDAAGKCATSLGARRGFYTTRDSVADIEAVRQQLGAPKIALLGVSYGTKVALAYARAHPGGVERLVLDSVVAEDGPSALALETLTSAEALVRARCRPGCAHVTPDPVRDLRRLASGLERRPLRGFVIDRRGHARRSSMTGSDLVLLLGAGDLDTSVRGALPAAMRSAVRGDPAPILRLLEPARRLDGEFNAPRELSVAAYAAASCEELEFPWKRTAPFGDRRRQARAFAAGLPGSAFGPFGPKTALGSDFLTLCERWQAASAPVAAGPALPDVPALLLAGDADSRTPVASARRVAADLPRSRVLVAPGTGHDVLGQDSTGCPTRAMRRFLAGVLAGPRCGRKRQPPLRTVAPVNIGDVPRKRGVPGRPGRVLGVVDSTLQFAAEEALLFLLTSVDDLLEGRGGTPTIRIGGLRGGTIGSAGPEGETMVLKRVALVRGVRVSGRIRAPFEKRQRGTLRITGRAAARGLLTIKGRRISGRLGGRLVSARLQGVDFERLTDGLIATAASERRQRPLVR
jgi:pimeloyl-ACP methyl ester carboxylesterase